MPNGQTTDWFSQNAPSQASMAQSGGDWFASNAPATKQENSSVPESHWLSATGNFLKDLAGGFGAGATQTIATVSRGLNKIPGIGETLAPSEGVKAMRIIGTPRNTGEKIGAGIEQAAELAATGPGKTLAAKIGIGALSGGASTAVHESGTSQGTNLADVLTSTAIGGIAPTAEAGVKSLFNSKFSRGLVNESVMATPTDVAYGNPAKALLDEGIATPKTGDIEKFKDAIRSGATLQGAAEAAGGRIAAINQKIGQLAPELHQKLAAAGTNRAAGATFSNLARIPASTVTDPIDNGIQAILKNRGVTAEDAHAAIKELQALKQAALKVPSVPGATTTAWAPLEANSVKQEIGQSTNWAGRERIGELVEPIKKQVYGNLKNSVNAAAPGTAALNERLTNLLAAQADVNKLAGFEEVGRGRSMGGVIGPSWMGRVEALAGRFVPAMSWLTPAVSPAIKTAIPAITQQNAGQRLSDLFEEQ
jgi:hypothetical protein